MRQVLATRHGAKLAIAPRALDVYTLMKRRGLTWDPQIFDVCRSLLQGGDVFYDLGANVGYMTVEMAVVFGGKVRCVAFEPQPDLARQIAISARLSGVGDAVTVFDAMIGEKPQQAVLQLTSHSIHASAVARERRATPLSREMTSLDALAASGAVPPPSVIKIDIEGGERSAFRGAESLIRQFAPHIVFEADANTTRFGYSREDLVRQLSVLADYEFLEITEDGKLLPLTDQSSSGNVLARSRNRPK